MQKLTMILFSLKKGGAGIAANKFIKLFDNNIQNFEVDSITYDESRYKHLIKRLISFGLSKLQYDNNPTKHSLNLFSYKPVLEHFKNIKDTSYHLHWINNDMLSIFDFDKIPSGSIITLHDEWLYCGAEHYYKVFNSSNDFKSGYNYFKRDVFGIHWNSLIWRVKFKKLGHRDDLIYTVPSKWMLERAKTSIILKNSDVRLLPNPIDTEIFKKHSENDLNLFRKSMNIDDDSFMVVFGAISGSKNKLKGMDILKDAFKKLQSSVLDSKHKKIVLVDFGGSTADQYIYGFRNISLGYVDKEAHLAKLYSAADCVVVPSIVESFGQVAAEALSCSTPVVCFNTSGLKDIVLHQHTGLLADSYSVESLCNQLSKMIQLSNENREIMGQNGREHVLKNFSASVVSQKYTNILRDAAKIKNSNTK
tara:strand:- start:1511 stop:2770 length:1260 start_codon:yes stop_codon:yes gene_type:complete